jgi:hypothetical protein
VDLNTDGALPDSNRIWKSLRVVDMLMSNMLGRPTSTADIDCTIPYDKLEDNRHHRLDASLQIFLVIERIVLEVYSRKCISLRIADYISHQIKLWAGKWMADFTEIVENPRQWLRREVLGACRNLCSYYYSIMLLTRPFLIYQLYDYLGVSSTSRGSHAEHQNKMKFGNAALDAASRMVEVMCGLIDEAINQREPMVM